MAVAVEPSLFISNRSLEQLAPNLADIVSAICFSILVVLVLLGNAYRRHSSDMPLASTCSAAISAACHTPPEDEDAYLLPVQWGVVNSEGELPVRCAFTTSRTVRFLKDGDMVSTLVDINDRDGTEIIMKSWQRLRKMIRTGHKSHEI